MSAARQPGLDFDAASAADEDGEALVVDLDGYEGPLHVLLALARAQKVDLRALSIARLADQYLAFVEAARARRFTLAADYLVMAAWLADLKSRLLLPRPPRGEVGPPEATAQALAFRLAKLDAMRGAVEALRARPQLGHDVFAWGGGQAAAPTGPPDATLYALVQAYAVQRLRTTRRRYSPPTRVDAYPLEAARNRLREALPELDHWTALSQVALGPESDGAAGPSRASYLASTLSAGLEMVRDGSLEISQRSAFADLYLRARAHARVQAVAA